MNLPFKNSKDFCRHIFGGIPMFVVPLLKHVNLRAGVLDVELDVLSETGIGEIRRTNQCR